MKILVSNRQKKIKFSRNYKALIKKAIEIVAEGTQICADFEVSVIITDDVDIHILNKEFRSVDNPTDVLSFPMLEFKGEENPEDILPLDVVCPLGDIVISLETAEKQALEYGHGIERELAFLTVHSMLHLFGYDHEDENDRKKMRNMEEYYLEKMGLAIGTPYTRKDGTVK